MPTPAALLFDLDGTLVHSVPDLHAALTKLLDADGRRIPTEAEVTRMVGNGVRKLVERAYAATGDTPEGLALDTLTERFMAVYGADPATLSRPYDGVPETLAALRAAGHPMAVCTNKPVQAARHLLKAMDLDPYFGAVIGGGSTPALKPDPAPVLAALAALAERAERAGLDGDTGTAVFIGDSPNDTQAARAAGLPVVCVTFGYRHCAPQDLGADALIDHFRDLPAALATLSPARCPAD